MTEDGILAKFEIVRRNLERLNELPQGSYAEFGADFRNLDSALHRLQTTIQALIDIASYIVSVRGLGIPRTSLDTLEKLEAASLLPAGSARRFAPIVGFRNRVVHLYDRIDPEVVYRILTENRDDLADLGAMLVKALQPAAATSGPRDT
ncbi:MAG: DUF86 domain-containing protein [Polyangiaceae bacterium]|nr:DUF86 domain-containing protein [Polyangiaceae bacterium]